MFYQFLSQIILKTQKGASPFRQHLRKEEAPFSFLTFQKEGTSYKGNPSCLHETTPSHLVCQLLKPNFFSIIT